MKEVKFSIIKWSAWAPGLNYTDDWQEWAFGNKVMPDDGSLPPLTDNIPPSQRRRLSKLTKMSLQVALECIKGLDNIESVFASRYGEWTQTLKLLRSIADKEEVSPAGFSMSVHNTAAGLYSIINKNISSYTAIAACAATFDAALIEALGRLKTKEKVLVVIAEEEVPELYKDIFFEPIKPYAIGFLLGKSDAPEAIAKFSIRPVEKKIEPLHALDFLKWYLRNNGANIETQSFGISHA